MSQAPKTSVPVIQQIRSMQWNFWVANIIEAGERLAFFGVRAVLPLYMVGTGSSELGLSYSREGHHLHGLGTAAVPDSDGLGRLHRLLRLQEEHVRRFRDQHRGYVIMANANGFGMMMTAGVFVGTGTAIFKPPVQGAVAKSLTVDNSGLGFGIFYWVVNIGGFLAPMAAAMGARRRVEPDLELRLLRRRHRHRAQLPAGDLPLPGAGDRAGRQGQDRRLWSSRRP